MPLMRWRMWCTERRLSQIKQLEHTESRSALGSLRGKQTLGTPACAYRDCVSTTNAYIFSSVQKQKQTSSSNSTESCESAQLAPSVMVSSPNGKASNIYKHEGAFG